ncbi:hypothetical protein F7725_006645, partial [Dissostichus mawsoni]
LNIWPSFHVALSNASVFVDFSTKSNSSTACNTSLSLVNTETNTTVQTRTLPDNQSAGRVEFNCSCFLYAGTFRFQLRQTSTSAVSPANGTHDSRVESTAWWWSSELQVQWPTFHIAVGISTNEHFQACSSGIDSALLLEVSYMEYNQIGRITIDKVKARKQHSIKPLRSQSVELSCAFPFTERDFIRVSLRSPHAAQDVKSSGPLYLSRIFSYKLLVENTNAYRSGCEGTMTVKLITPPCVHINGKVMLYKDAGVGRGVAVSSGMAGGGTALGPEEPSSPLLAYNWLTQGENETEFNCSVFDPGRYKYCFRFVFNFSHSPSPAQTCLVVHKSAVMGPVAAMECVQCELWRGGEGARARVFAALRCGGDAVHGHVLPTPSPSLPPVGVGATPLGGNIVVVAGISLCLAVILATVVVTLWRKLCKTPQCNSVRRGSMHSPGGRKLSDEASICGHSLQRPSLIDGHGLQGGIGVGVGVGVGVGSPERQAFFGPWLYLSHRTRKAFPHMSEAVATNIRFRIMLLLLHIIGKRILSFSNRNINIIVFRYRLAQQQLKEMKKKGIREAIQLYHVSSSPVHDTLVETSALPTSSLIPTPTGFTHPALPLDLQDDAKHNYFQSQTPRATPDRLSPRVELVLGPSASAHARGGSSNRRDRTADWVEMVERSGLSGLRGEGGDAEMGNSYHKNPNFRRTSSFNDTKPQPLSSVHSRQFRERSMTQVGSRTLPEGSCWNKGGRDRQPYSSYPIPEHGTPDWAKSRAQRNDQRKPWIDTAATSHNNEIKHTGTNTNSISASEKHVKADLSGTGGGQGISGIGGPAAGPQHLSVDRAERAEQNWNRRGPSPIQRNILARKLKEAQSCSGVRGRQRSSTFSATPTEQRTGRCNSLPMSGGYRLSEAEQRMLDLDLSSAYVGEEE